jgi:hypothetical protein
MAEKEYIEREPLKRDLIDRGFYPAIVKAAIENAPTADAVEAVHGEWIPIEHEYRNNFERVMIADEFDCSICGRRLGYRANYCPNCGAKMDGKDGKI